MYKQEYRFIDGTVFEGYTSDQEEIQMGTYRLTATEQYSRGPARDTSFSQEFEAPDDEQAKSRASEMRPRDPMRELVNKVLRRIDRPAVAEDSTVIFSSRH